MLILLMSLRSQKAAEKLFHLQYVRWIKMRPIFILISLIREENLIKKISYITLNKRHFL